MRKMEIINSYKVLCRAVDDKGRKQIRDLRDAETAIILTTPVGAIVLCRHYDSHEDNCRYNSNLRKGRCIYHTGLESKDLNTFCLLNFYAKTKKRY